MFYLPVAQHRTGRLRREGPYCFVMAREFYNAGIQEKFTNSASHVAGRGKEPLAPRPTSPASFLGCRSPRRLPALPLSFRTPRVLSPPAPSFSPRRCCCQALRCARNGRAMRAFEGTRSATTSVRCPNSFSRRSVETQDARRSVATEALPGVPKPIKLGARREAGYSGNKSSTGPARRV